MSYLYKLSKEILFLLGQVNKPKEIFSNCKKVVKFIFIVIEKAENHESLYILNRSAYDRMEREQMTR